MAKIYVVIPVYNVEEYLRECVDSVLRQPYKDIDIVLVDDGSEDNSGKICDEIVQNDTRVSVIHQKNKGISGARNTGIEFVLNRASGDDYIAFLDSDDFWVSDTITEGLIGEKLFTDILTFSMYYTNSTGKRFMKNTLYYVGEFLEPRKNSFWSAPHMWCSFYRVSLVKENNLRFSNKTNFGEDECFKLYAMYHAKHAVGIDIPLVCYRNNEKSIMHTSGRRPIAPFLGEIDAILNDLQKYKIIDSEYCKRMEFYCCWLLLEMSEEYYRNLNFGNLPYTTIRDHCLHEAFCANASSLPNSDGVCKRIYFMLNNQYLFKAKLISVGMLRRCLQYIISIPVFKTVYEKKKYPITDLNE